MFDAYSEQARGRSTALWIVIVSVIIGGCASGQEP